MKSLKVSGIVFYLFGLVLALLLYYYLFFIPQSAAVKELDLLHTQRAEQIEEYNAQLAGLDELKTRVGSLREQVENGSLKNAVTAQNVSEDVAAACAAAGVTPSSVQTGGENVDPNHLSSDGKPLCSVSVNLALSCPNDRLLALLNYFETTSPGAYYVEKADWKNGGAGQQTAAVTMTLYYFGSVANK